MSFSYCLVARKGRWNEESQNKCWIERKFRRYEPHLAERERKVSTIEIYLLFFIFSALFCCCHRLFSSLWPLYCSPEVHHSITKRRRVRGMMDLKSSMRRNRPEQINCYQDRINNCCFLFLSFFVSCISPSGMFWEFCTYLNDATSPGLLIQILDAWYASLLCHEIERYLIMTCSHATDYHLRYCTDMLWNLC